MFVYGTLRKGQCRNSILSCCEFIGLGILYHFLMYDLGEYPAIIPGNGKVKGELYVVNKEILKELDYIEGVPFLFKREKVCIRLLNSEYHQLEAYAYVYCNKIQNKLLIEHGDWIIYKKSFFSE
ncbi:gamma-glutamylcyclotransferase family protein [Methylacidiphilum kamchatkense]|uniref:gamma-glutamylcyclotransferase family protein n=1 Tax=Methylacidiphilum kamchatkense TaxID=431057 RepID=UPI00228554AA|nr:gamma-glutamylcyclotransferase family protein [Methylacidiphilum kamchatkense]